MLSGSALQQLPCVIPSAPGGSFALNDSRSESKLSGTAVLSYKPTDRLLTYASYSRGYKARRLQSRPFGAVSRAAVPTTVPPTPGTVVLSNPPLSGSGAICASAAQTGCQGIVASGADLQFKPEINDAFEAGFKYHGRGIDLNFALFHEVFRNFQLNTFNGLNFFVENINSCSDQPQRRRYGQQSANRRLHLGPESAPACAARASSWRLSRRPLPDVAWNAGVTMADTKYRKNLVGANGQALNNALFQLPGRRISNAPLWTVTGSVAWTPRLVERTFAVSSISMDVT